MSNQITTEQDRQNLANLKCIVEHGEECVPDDVRASVIEWAADRIDLLWGLFESAREERDELWQTVERLPKTADGVPVVPGQPQQELWTAFPVSGNVHEGPGSIPGYFNSDCDKWFSRCYSTRAAAEAAALKGGAE